MIRVLVFALLLSGCGTLSKIMEPAPVDPLYTYKADIIITLSGVNFDGFASGRLLQSQAIQLRSKAALNLLQISSCHRTFSVENVDTDWFGGVGHQYTYQYSPTELEKTDFCPLYVQAFDASGSTAWGMVAFLTSETLPFEITCNGSVRQSPGMAICQAQSSQVQGLKFQEQVKLAYSPECAVENPSDSQNFIISSKSGFCVITAKAIADKSRYARILLLGYKHQHVR